MQTLLLTRSSAFTIGNLQFPSLDDQFGHFMDVISAKHFDQIFIRRAFTLSTEAHQMIMFSHECIILR
jgi:hypothetical protein